MIDITSIQTFEVPREFQILNSENIFLKKENEGIKILGKTVVFLTIGVGLFILIKKYNEEYR